MEPNTKSRNFAYLPYTPRAIEFDYVSIPHQHVVFLSCDFGSTTGTTGTTSGGSGLVVNCDCDADYEYDPRDNSLPVVSNDVLLTLDGNTIQNISGVNVEDL